MYIQYSTASVYMYMYVHVYTCITVSVLAVSVMIYYQVMCIATVHVAYEMLVQFSLFLDNYMYGIIYMFM